jgi:glyoxylase-like metal-dependent hydrolase (beta-lactamase superfamily II)
VAAFVEIAADVHVLRYPVLDVNATLVVGTEIAAIVDTLATDAQAQELLDEVRRVTDLPLVMINTHHHFDHCFGNHVISAACAGTGIWAHEEAARILREEGSTWQRDWYVEWLDAQPELANALAAVQIVPPDRTIHTESIMDIGGRTIELRHFGRGHTEGDLVVCLPDVDVVLAGDLVEQGAPPSFEDSFPIQWPETLAALLHDTTTATIVVPGHGAVVDIEFVRAQHDELTALAWLIREGHGDGAAAQDVAAKAPFGIDAARPAVARGFAELAGKI